MNKIYIIIVTVFLFSHFNVHARIVNAVGWTNKKETLYVKTGGEYKEIHFRNNRASPVVDIGSDEQIYFYEKIPQADEVIKPVAEISLLDREKELLLIFFPFTGDNGMKWKVLAKDDSVEKFPLNTMDIINMTAKQMGGFVGGKKVVLRPMKTESIDLSHIKKFSFQLKVNSYNKETKKTKQHVRQSLSYRPGIRIIGILMNENPNLQTEPFWSIIRIGPNKGVMDVSVQE